MFQHLPFPFEDGQFPSALGAVVQKTVLSGQRPAREVIHAPDGSWLVGDGVNDPNLPGASIATHIAHAIQRNLSLIHISEPTRLGMISYAVFCLKKKKKTKTQNIKKH